MSTPTPRQQWADAVWETETLDHIDKLICLAYAKFATRGIDDVYVTGPELQRITRLSKSAIHAHIKHIVNAGWLVTVRREVRRATRYALRIPEQGNTDQEPNNGCTTVAQPLHDGDTQSTRRGHDESSTRTHWVHDTDSLGPPQGHQPRTNPVSNHISSISPDSDESGATDTPQHLPETWRPTHSHKVQIDEHELDFTGIVTDFQLRMVNAKRKDWDKAFSAFIQAVAIGDEDDRFPTGEHSGWMCPKCDGPLPKNFYCYRCQIKYKEPEQ